MKLKDGFYKSSNGIGGLMLDMPTKNPKHVRNQKSKSVTWFAVKQKGSFIPSEDTLKRYCQTQQSFVSKTR